LGLYIGDGKETSCTRLLALDVHDPLQAEEGGKGGKSPSPTNTRQKISLQKMQTGRLGEAESEVDLRHMQNHTQGRGDSLLKR